MEVNGIRTTEEHDDLCSLARGRLGDQGSQEGDESDKAKFQGDNHVFLGQL